MKKFVITEEEKQRILTMHQNATKRQYIKEEESEPITGTTLSEPPVEEEIEDTNSAQNVANNMGLNIDIKELVDESNPSCVPMTGDSEKDGIISKIWDWANDDSTSISDLKNSITKLRDTLKKAKENKNSEMSEQLGLGAVLATTIGGITLGGAILIGIGVIVLGTLIVALVKKLKKRKKGKRRKSGCKKRNKALKKRGIEGLF